MRWPVSFRPSIVCTVCLIAPNAFATQTVAADEAGLKERIFLGIVVDPEGESVREASVELIGTVRVLKKNATTDKRGQFTFFLPKRLIGVLVEDPATGQSTMVELKADQRALEIQLKPVGTARLTIQNELGQALPDLELNLHATFRVGRATVSSPRFIRRVRTDATGLMKLDRLNPDATYQLKTVVRNPDRERTSLVHGFEVPPGETLQYTVMIP